MEKIADIAARLTQGMNSNAPREFVQKRNNRTVERATLDTLDTTNASVRAAVDMCRRWQQRLQAGHSDASIVLCGGVGTGKTHMARAVLWSICYRLDDGDPIGYAGKFFMGGDLVMMMSPTRNEFNVTETPKPSAFIGNSPIVVIDDIGSEPTIPFVKADDQAVEIEARYFQVINYCYQYQISLVITSNLSIEQLKLTIGKRSWDRLSEMAPQGFMIDLANVPSWRQKASGREV